MKNPASGNFYKQGGYFKFVNVLSELDQPVRKPSIIININLAHPTITWRQPSSLPLKLMGMLMELFYNCFKWYSEYIKRFKFGISGK